MEVFRIENVDGLGPYACGDVTGLRFEEQMRNLGQDHDLVYVHPIVRARLLSGAAVYGFNSMAQLRRWFDYFGQHGYDLLKAKGFHVAVYETDDVEMHDRQVIFEKGAASTYLKRIEEVPEICTPMTRVG